MRVACAAWIANEHWGMSFEPPPKMGYLLPPRVVRRCEIPAAFKYMFGSRSLPTGHVPFMHIRSHVSTHELSLDFLLDSILCWMLRPDERGISIWPCSSFVGHMMTDAFAESAGVGPAFWLSESIEPSFTSNYPLWAVNNGHLRIWFS